SARAISRRSLSEILTTRPVVTTFLEHDGKILLLRRSETVRTYPGRWAAVSGSIDSGHTPEQQARVEINEETQLTDADVRLLVSGEPLEFHDADIGHGWIVHPFRFSVRSPERIKLNWENVEFRWIDPHDLNGYETVPRLTEVWERVAPRDT
ncbi:MAG TPA: NUDIX pyrophosphatase, partial [Chloroflexota bacterium]|nr:NUDIX pyrophosphatase [Chloroflexota bacterium]